MNIIVSNASKLWGGLHTVTESLVAGFQDRGHRVRVLCRAGSILHERLERITACDPILGGMDWNPLTIGRVARTLRRHNADVVLVLKDKDMTWTVPAAALVGVPGVVRRADDRPIKNRPDGALLWGRLTAHHVANSCATRRTMLQSAPWLDARKVSVIYNGIDPETFQRAVPADLGLPQGALAVGFVGRIETRKGIFELAEAWPHTAAALPDAHLLVVGRGPEEAAAKERLAAAPRVHWLGYRPDVPALMKALDLLVVPSHWEGFGFVVAEGMAAGVAIAASRASNLPELFRDGVEGRFFAVRDAADLQRVVREMAADPPSLARMGAAGVDRVRECFTTRGMVDEYEALLRRVARGDRAFAPPAEDA